MSDSEVKAQAEKLSSAVNKLKIENAIKDKPQYLTISQGIKNGIPDDNAKPWDYLTLADNSLYEVKKHKKGGIVLA